MTAGDDAGCHVI